MEYIQQLGDLHMMLHINKKLYAGGKITREMYEYANRTFTERLYRLESSAVEGLQETA